MCSSCDNCERKILLNQIFLSMDEKRSDLKSEERSDLEESFCALASEDSHFKNPARLTEPSSRNFLAKKYPRF